MKIIIINNKMLDLDKDIRDEVFAGDCRHISWSGYWLDQKLKAVLEIMTKPKASYKFCKHDRTWGLHKNMKDRGHLESQSIKS